METVLGVDLGTSGIKALLVGSRGQLLGEARSDMTAQHPRPGWSEQEPAAWWRALARAVAQLESEHAGALASCRAVGVSGQMHGSVLLDGHGAVRGPAILWNDNRSAGVCRQVTAELGLDRLLALAGNRAFPGFTGPKIRWLRDHDPDRLAGVAHLMLPKDYLVHRLTGTFSTDVSDASGTLLLDVGRRTWSDELCSIWSVEPGWLPSVHESSAVVGRIREEVALPGLPGNIPVVAGAGDQAAAAVGTGITRAGRTSVCVGTSGVVFAQTETYRPDPGGILHAFGHAVSHTWHVMGVMLSAGGALDWFARSVPAPGGAASTNGETAFDRVTRSAAAAAPGAGGVIFLPYLAGERCPHPDPEARATLHGMHLGTTYDDLARAVLEGIVTGLADCADRIEQAGNALAEVRVTGGGTRSPFLMDLLASALNRPIEIAAVDEGSAYGAALLAGVGAGWAPDVPTMATQWDRPGEPHEPTADLAAELAEVQKRRRALYERTRTNG